jgi:hypothetical protein
MKAVNGFIFNSESKQKLYINIFPKVEIDFPFIN